MMILDVDASRKTFFRTLLEWQPVFWGGLENLMAAPRKKETNWSNFFPSQQWPLSEDANGY